MDKIIRSDISKEMRERYIDYAMNVIVDRALPDVRDGLKPVHRRILYAMYELGLFPEKGYRKCARVVGDTLGKYHPHGDTSVYGALVRMAQDFSMRYPLVDGHGNFGSIDGDGAAAMRYTESKMDKLAMEMLRDINKNIVDFKPNFDGEEQEPTVLPSRFPNVLVNGSSGIAVGMATNIPPHNLGEVINGTIQLIDNPNLTTSDLLEYIKAPDFPLGATIINSDEISKIYETGTGKLIVRGKYHIEKEGNHKLIVFTDIPSQVNKANTLEKIADLVYGKDRILKNITDIRDESDKHGIRIVIEIKASTDEKLILAQLFRKTKLQDNCNVNMLVLVNNEPKVLSLKEILNYYIEYQKEIITRRSQFDLNKINNRLHILKGLKIALDKIDLVISLIRESKNSTSAKEKLIEILNITDIQAQAILDLKLQRLTNLDRDKIDIEFENLNKNRVDLELILSDNHELLKLLKTELLEIKNKYSNPRRTEILSHNPLNSITNEDFIEDYNCTISYTKNYIKKLKKKSDKNIFKDGEILIDEIPSTNKSKLIFFTNKANRYVMNSYDLDDDMKPSKIGQFIPNLIDLEENEEIIRIVSVEDEQQGHIVSVYENGKINKTPVKQFISNYTKIVNCYNTDSKLIDIDYIKSVSDILFLSAEGKALITNTNNRSKTNTKNSMGVQGIKLGENGTNKCIGCIINVIPEFKFEIHTKKGKIKEFMLDDIAPTGKPNEERSLFKYLYGRRNNRGNFVIKTRTNEDEIMKFKVDR